MAACSLVRFSASDVNPDYVINRRRQHGFAVHQWWRGYHMMAIAFIAVAWLVAGIAIETAKNNQKAAAAEHIDEVLRQP